jgi:hypothetical protein
MKLIDIAAGVYLVDKVFHPQSKHMSIGNIGFLPYFMIGLVFSIFLVLSYYKDIRDEEARCSFIEQMAREKERNEYYSNRGETQFIHFLP